MIHSALLLHMEVVSEGEMETEREDEIQLKNDLAFGNKLVILGGDLLLISAESECVCVRAMIRLCYHDKLLGSSTDC